MATEPTQAPRPITPQFDPDRLEPFLRALWRGFKAVLGKLQAADKCCQERALPRPEPTYWDQVLGKGPAGRDDD